MRDHDVTSLTASELEHARRELAASLALTRPASPARVPILAHLTAIDAEIVRRAASRLDGLPGSLSLIPGWRGARLEEHPGPTLVYQNHVVGRQW